VRGPVRGTAVTAGRLLTAAQASRVPGITALGLAGRILDRLLHPCGTGTRRYRADEVETLVVGPGQRGELAALLAGYPDHWVIVGPCGDSRWFAVPRCVTIQGPPGAVT
jgi:hypothetical protein